MFRNLERYGIPPTDISRSKTKFTDPYKWKGPRRIFTCSWSDFFIEQADAWRPEAWEIIKNTPNHTYQILTKRPERIGNCLPPDWGDRGYPNVWLGVSIELQTRIYRLQELYNAVYTPKRSFKCFISAEPLLGPLDFLHEDANTEFLFTEMIDWVIIGGESGNNTGKYRYRPCDITWIYELIMQCKEKNKSIFVKQLGSYLAKALHLSNGHGNNISEFPQSIQLRQYP